PGRTPLSWRTRIQIAIDVANALEYLHLYCDPPLRHRDIKSSNTLLDENFVAKMSCIPGYMDPEYVVTLELTEKSDIYSFGVLLLEIVTGSKLFRIIRTWWNGRNRNQIIGASRSQREGVF
ncbi:hypothetical protein HN873_038795, partial [Arachis hypogaea]